MAAHAHRRVTERAPESQNPGPERIDASVRGIVQGVGFRWFVVRRAAQLGLVGWTSNEADGSVRVVAEGEPGGLRQLLSRLKEGPPGAQVQAVDVSWTPATGEFTNFGIRSGSHRGD